VFEKYVDGDEGIEHDHGPSEHEHGHHYPISFLLAFVGYTLILMVEKVIFDNHNHGAEDDGEEEENKTLTGEDREINLINVNNNFNITIPAKDANGIKEIINLNSSSLKRIPSQSNLNSNSRSSFSICM
jgi:hypothetical protein